MAPKLGLAHTHQRTAKQQHILQRQRRHFEDSKPGKSGCPSQALPLPSLYTGTNSAFGRALLIHIKGYQLPDAVMQRQSGEKNATDDLKRHNCGIVSRALAVECFPAIVR